MHVRVLTTQDLERYRALMLHAYDSAADVFTSTREERAAEPDSWWARRIADPSGLSIGFGAFEGEALVGTVTLEFSSRAKTKHRALVVGMFVSEAARGRGVGKALLEEALSTAQARSGVQVVRLTVTEGNTPAVRLYESVGFKAFGVEPMAIATPDGLKGKVHMWLPLLASRR